MREDLEEGRLMRRLGMPEDYVFDEILSLENAREHSEDEWDGEDEASDRSSYLRYFNYSFNTKVRSLSDC